MSGAMPACSQAKSFPVHPKPVAISSAMSSTACASPRGAGARLRRRGARAQGRRRRRAHTVPPAPAIGSPSAHAAVRGILPQRRASGACRRPRLRSRGAVAGTAHGKPSGRAKHGLGELRRAGARSSAAGVRLGRHEARVARHRRAPWGARRGAPERHLVGRPERQADAPAAVNVFALSRCPVLDLHPPPTEKPRMIVFCPIVSSTCAELPQRSFVRSEVGRPLAAATRSRPPCLAA